MRSRHDDVDPGLAVERALASGVCGVGGRLSTPPSTLAEALARTDDEYDERTAAAAGAVRRGADRLLRVDPGHRRPVLPRKAHGEWRYDASPDALAADLVHVRACDWLARPVPPERVPAATLATFARADGTSSRPTTRRSAPTRPRCGRRPPPDRLIGCSPGGHRRDHGVPASTRSRDVGAPAGLWASPVAGAQWFGGGEGGDGREPCRGTRRRGHHGRLRRGRRRVVRRPGRRLRARRSASGSARSARTTRWSRRRGWPAGTRGAAP